MLLTYLYLRYIFFYLLVNIPASKRQEHMSKSYCYKLEKQEIRIQLLKQTEGSSLVLMSSGGMVSVLSS